MNATFDRAAALKAFRLLRRSGGRDAVWLRITAAGKTVVFACDNCEAAVPALVVQRGAFTTRRPAFHKLLASFSHARTVTLQADASRFRIGAFSGQLLEYDAQPVLRPKTPPEDGGAIDVRNELTLESEPHQVQLPLVYPTTPAPRTVPPLVPSPPTPTNLDALESLPTRARFARLWRMLGRCLEHFLSDLGWRPKAFTATPAAVPGSRCAASAQQPAAGSCVKEAAGVEPVCDGSAADRPAFLREPMRRNETFADFLARHAAADPHADAWIRRHVASQPELCATLMPDLWRRLGQLPMRVVASPPRHNTKSTLPPGRHELEGMPKALAGRSGIVPMRTMLDLTVGLEVAVWWLERTDFIEEIAANNPLQLFLKNGLYKSAHGPVMWLLFFVPDVKRGGDPLVMVESHVNLSDPQQVGLWTELAEQTHWHVILVDAHDAVRRVYEFENHFRLGEALELLSTACAGMPITDFMAAKAELAAAYSAKDLYSMKW